MKKIIAIFLVASIATSSVPADAIASGELYSGAQAGTAFHSLGNQALALAAGVFPRATLNAKNTQRLDRQTPTAAALKPNGQKQSLVGKGKVGSFVERWYFTGMAIVMIAIAVAGFLPAIAHPETRRGPLTVLATLHGVVFSAWLVLVLAQSLLVALKRTAWHRKLGLTAIALLAAMIPLGFTTTTAMVRRGFDLSGDLRIEPHPTSTSGTLDPITGSVFNYCTLLFFGVTTVTAFAFRRRADLHKRLMVFANIALITAPIAHLAGHFPQIPMWVSSALYLSLLLSVVARDYVVKKRVSVLSLLLAIFMYIAVPLQLFVIAPSETWRRLIHWIALRDVPAQQRKVLRSA